MSRATDRVFTLNPTTEPIPHYQVPTIGNAMGAIVMEPAGTSGIVIDRVGTSGLGAIGDLAPLFVGLGTAAVGGAATGYLAAGHAKGALIGASFNTGLWSALTLAGTWQASDTTTKAVLGVGALAGAGLTAFYVLKRRKGR